MDNGRPLIAAGWLACVLRVPFFLVVPATLLTLLSGCAKPPVPDHHWEIIVYAYEGPDRQRDGHLKRIVLHTDAFDNPTSVSCESIEGLVADGKWGFDVPGRDLLLTMECDKDSQGRDTDWALRLYDKRMNLLAGYVLAGCVRQGSGKAVSMPVGFPSAPCVSSCGQRLAFIDSDGTLYAGSIGEDRINVNPVVLPLDNAVVADHSRNACFWVDDHHLAISSGGWNARVVDVKNGEVLATAKKRLHGVSRGRIVTQSGSLDDVEFLDLQGNVVDRRCKDSTVLAPKSKRYWYPGHWVHRISPDGEFLAYESQTFWGGEPGLFVRHLKTGRELFIHDIGSIRGMGSWCEIQDR